MAGADPTTLLPPRPRGVSNVTRPSDRRLTRVPAALVLALLLAGGCTVGDPAADPGPEAAGTQQAGAQPESAQLESAQPESAQPESTQPQDTQPGSAERAGSRAAEQQTTEIPCTVPPRLRGQDVERLPVTEKVVALTFDGGGSAAGVTSILDTLAARAVPATFFLTGDFVTAFPARSRRIAREHLVGNHTMGHRDLTTLGDDAVARQVRRAERVIRETTGEDPRRFFRFPFGARTPHAVSELNELCYVPFRWTVDSLGWKGTKPGGMTVAAVVDRVVAARTPGAIVLMHVGANPDDGTTLDAAALPRVVDRLRGHGYRFVRLSRILAAAP